MNGNEISLNNRYVFEDIPEILNCEIRSKLSLMESNYGINSLCKMAKFTIKELKQV